MWTPGYSSNPFVPKDVMAVSMSLMILMMIGILVEGVAGSPSFFQMYNEGNRCGQVIGEITVPSLSACATACHQAKGCIGFNLQISLAKNQRSCQTTINYDSCVSDAGFTYFIDPKEIVPPPIKEACGTFPTGFALVGIELDPMDDVKLSQIYVRSVNFAPSSNQFVTTNQDCPANTVLIVGSCTLPTTYPCQEVTGGTRAPCDLVVSISGGKAMCPKKMAVTKIDVKTQGNKKIEAIVCCEVDQW
ncbi:uncharacterized protein LOC135214591 [Macrobrachium nipponense]|uniref:uncharacterized protein LOC135214591 n=1 Tax=Macrobrachium nipponense TaxID=159736 RepID=UPI0030C8BD3F